MIRLSIVILCAVACVGTSPARAQESLYRTRQLSAGAELFTFVPSGSAFRTNYAQSLFVGSARIPIGLSLFGRYQYSPRVAITVGIGWSKALADENNNIAWSITSLTFGALYCLPRSIITLPNSMLSGGISLGIYPASFSATFPSVNGMITDKQSRLGYGLRCSAMVDHRVTRAMTAGVALHFDINTFGDTDRGGWGNLGGLSVALRWSVTP